MMNVSVVMATYNGDKYIKEQLDSIMCQLSNEDELIVSDDGSSDSTCEIINEYKNNYKNIRLFNSNHLGASKNFLKAIHYSKNDIIILSDQDDICEKDKISKTKKYFENNENIKVMLHNFTLIDINGNAIDNTLKIRYHHGYFTNIIRSCYWGCAMAIKKDFLDMLKHSNNVVAHDQYIGLLAEKHRVAGFLDESLLKHRIHSSNVSKKLNNLERIKFRANLLLNTIFK